MDRTVIVDSREQKPYEFPEFDNVITDALNVGDYSLHGIDREFAIERKTLDDLATSLGTDRDRFEREIKRAQTYKDFVVVIEAPAGAVYDFRDNSNCPNYYSNIHPNSIIGTVEKWPTKYDTLGFEWCDDRQGARDYTAEALRRAAQEYF